MRIAQAVTWPTPSPISMNKHPSKHYNRQLTPCPTGPSETANTNFLCKPYLPVVLYQFKYFLEQPNPIHGSHSNAESAKAVHSKQNHTSCPSPATTSQVVNNPCSSTSNCATQPV